MEEIITYDDFAKLELRIGTVRDAVRVEGSRKLLKLRVDIGSEERQILAGVGTVYTPEEMISRQIVIIINLAPRMMMGLESQGMLLAADGENGPVLLQPQKEVHPGVGVK